MSVLANIPAFQMLGDGVASGHPFSYFVAEHIIGVFLYEPTPTIIAGFVNECGAQTFVKAATGGCKSYSIYVSRQHYEFYATKLPGFEDKWKDRIIG